METLVVDDVSKHFGGVQALRGVTFHVEEGTTFGLIGPNGSGKSTLLNIVSGADRPTSGSVYLRGKKIDSLSPEKIATLGLAKANQIPKILNNLTVKENVAIAVMYGAGREKNVDAAFNKAARILSTLGLEDKIESKSKGLTTQEQKGIELARTIATGATVILLDEVFAGLSPEELKQSLEAFKKIRTELGLTTVVVEHIMRAVVQISDRIGVLQEGVMIAEGEPDEVLKDGKVVSAYLGSSAL